MCIRDRLQGAQEQARGEQDSEDGQAGGDRLRPQAPGEDLELGDEAGEARQPQRGEGSDAGQRGEDGRPSGHAGVRGHLVRTPALVQHAGQQEQRPGQQPVTDHLEDRTGDGQTPGLRLVRSHGPGGTDGQGDVAHVVDGGVGDHPFEVGLREGDQRAVQHGDHADADEDEGVLAPGVGQDGHGDAQEAVGAHLQQHPGEDRRPGGRGLGVRGWQPGVEGHGRGFHRQSDGDGQEDESAVCRASGRRVGVGQLDDVEGVGFGGQVEADEAEQQSEGAEEGVEEELQGGAGGAPVSPPRDDEVHHHDGQVEEDEEEDQVQGGEQAEAGGLEEQEQGRELPGPSSFPPGVRGAGEEQHAGDGHQGQGQAVDADVVADARAGDPAGPGLVLHALAVLIARPDDHRQDQVGCGCRRPGRQEQAAGGAARHAQQERRHGGGEQDDGREHDGHLTRTRTTARTVKAATA